MKPGEKLLFLLESLRERLNHSGVERTVGLRDEMGEDCPFYHQSLSLFLLEDYAELSSLIDAANLLIQECEELSDES